MAEWWQSPAYLQRQAAGQVQTPGLIDIGGLTQRLYDDFQAPYWRRQDEIQGAAVADPMQSRYVAQPRFVAKMQPPQPRTAAAPTMQPGMYGRGQTVPMPAAPNQPSGTIVAFKDQQRLPGDPRPYNGLAYGYDAQPNAPANPAVAAIEKAVLPYGMRALAPTPARGINAAAGMVPALGQASNNRYTASMRFASPNAGQSDGIIDLGDAFDPKAGQSFANTEGKPVRIKGVIYYPGGRAPQGAPAPRAATTQQRSGGLGGLLGSLFGGGNLGSGRAALESGWTEARSSIGTSPSQGQAMTVDPNTSTGSTLSSMGFSSGALVPAATIRNLESRGYFN